MKIRRLQIEQQMAKLHIESQIARLSIQSPIRRIKSVDRQNAQMIVEREGPSLEIENMRTRVDTLTRQDVPAAVTQVRQDKINGSHAAAYLQGNNSVNTHPARVKITAVRTAGFAGGGHSDNGRKITGSPGSLQIDWAIQDISINWDEYQAPVITVDPKPSVEIWLAQEARVEIKIVEQTYPPETGEMIDEEV